MTTTVTDNQDRRRYEIQLDDQLAGFAAYRDEDDLLAFTHTEIDPRCEGQGLGSTLVRGALDDVRRRGVGILPYCSFVRAYLARHPEYLDLVPADRRAQFDLDGD